tara:strand:- start:781 stop:1809 length:1029 start_codon:yes stop_codon:yes gene_type:complete
MTCSSDKSLILIDWDECMSPIDLCGIFLRGSDINRFHKSKKDQKKRIEKVKTKIQQKLDLGRKHPMSKWCDMNQVSKNPESIRKAIGLTSTKLEPKYTRRYISFVRHCLLPNKHIICSLEKLIKNYKIMILTNGRIFCFVRCLFYHKFPNNEDGKYINRFLKLFDFQIYGDKCIEICARPSVREYLPYRCIYKYDSSLKPKDKGLREFIKNRNRKYKIGETDRYLELTKFYDSHISDNKSIFIFKDLLKDKDYKKFKTILYFDDNLWLPNNSELKQIHKYSYWINKDLNNTKLEYVSASVKTPKFVCFDVPKKSIGLSIFKTQKKFLNLIEKTLEHTFKKNL